MSGAVMEIARDRVFRDPAWAAGIASGVQGDDVTAALRAVSRRELLGVGARARWLREWREERSSERSFPNILLAAVKAGWRPAMDGTTRRFESHLVFVDAATIRTRLVNRPCAPHRGLATPAGRLP